VAIAFFSTHPAARIARAAMPQRIPDEQELLTPDECAKLLKIKPQTLRFWRIKASGPPYHKIGRRLIRYVRGEVRAWATEQAAA
jgi:predicted DNA-binding transcriptional regulator AlpA